MFRSKNFSRVDKDDVKPEKKTGFFKMKPLCDRVRKFFTVALVSSVIALSPMSCSGGADNANPDAAVKSDAGAYNESDGGTYDGGEVGNEEVQAQTPNFDFPANSEMLCSMGSEIYTSFMEQECVNNIQDRYVDACSIYLLWTSICNDNDIYYIMYSNNPEYGENRVVTDRAYFIDMLTYKDNQYLSQVCTVTFEPEMPAYVGFSRSVPSELQDFTKVIGNPPDDYEVVHHAVLCEVRTIAGGVFVNERWDGDFVIGARLVTDEKYDQYKNEADEYVEQHR